MLNHIITTFFVFVQFTSIGLLLILGIQSFPEWYIIILLGISVFIGAMAIWSMRKSAFSIFPDVHKNAKLIDNGIYAYLRHPMYLAVLIFASAMIIHNPFVITYSIFGILTINMFAKLLYEEKQLLRSFPEYSDYMTRTKRLLPFVW